MKNYLLALHINIGPVVDSSHLFVNNKEEYFYYASELQTLKYTVCNYSRLVIIDNH